MFCSQCGVEKNDSASFCKECRVPSNLNETTDRKMVSFKEAIKLGFKNIFNFWGRSTRAEFWWWYLFTWLLLIPPVILDVLFNTIEYDQDFGLFSGIYMIFAAYSWFVLAIRRLHDFGWSGWAVLLVWIPIIGWIPVGMMMFKGSEGTNKYDLPFKVSS